MKFPINLASQPFRRDRAMIAASIAVSLLLVVTLGGLGSLILLDRSQLADVRADLAHLNRAIRDVNAEQAKLDAVLRRPENTEVLERSVLLNQLLYRKGISWTKILEDLGTTLPYNVQIINIRPFVNKDNKITLDMQVAAQTQGAIIDLLKALESSPLFQDASAPTIQAPTQTEPLYRSRVLVNYAQKL
ncbi:MAG: PilN domain-containing protein [Acidobacteriia bacterium]|nr:PilN domain-containing protein [Terriglobia bacterium]MBV8904627.1 PilN domain-containing protein [Terriglobia bacterium]